MAVRDVISDAPAESRLLRSKTPPAALRPLSQKQPRGATASAMN